MHKEGRKFYKDHECFPLPEDQTVKVWKYLDLPKFIWLLENRKLYFTRLDQLGDAHEGSITVAEKKDMRIFFKEKNISKEALKAWTKFRKSARRILYVNCWHLNFEESEAMWTKYCPDDKGLALQTTFEKLAESVINDRVHIGMVSYIDYNADYINMSGNIIAPAMHKRKAYSYENEVRIIYHSLEDLNSKIKRPYGNTIDWNIEDTIENIFINPNAEKWYRDVIRAVVIKFAPILKKRIQWSALRAVPVY